MSTYDLRFWKFLPRSPSEQPIELILLYSWHIMEFSLEGFVHDLVLSQEYIVLLSESINILTGLNNSLSCKALKER